MKWTKFSMRLLRDELKHKTTPLPSLLYNLLDDY